MGLAALEAAVTALEMATTEMQDLQIQAEAEAAEVLHHRLQQTAVMAALGL